MAYRLALDHPERVLRLAVLTLEAWARLDRQAGLAMYHWLSLAQPADLPELLIGSDLAYFLRWTLESWALSQTRSIPECSRSTSGPSRTPR